MSCNQQTDLYIIYGLSNCNKNQTNDNQTYENCKLAYEKDKNSIYNITNKEIIQKFYEEGLFDKNDIINLILRHNQHCNTNLVFK